MKRLLIRYYDTSNVTIDNLLNSSYLSIVDKLSLEKYKNKETKKEKIVSTIFKNKYIGEYKINEHGKPISENRFFNISHSHGLVVFIEDVVPVGIDIEQIQAVKNGLIDFVSNKEEKNYIHDEQSFYEIWTNKEALVKALGTGIKVRPNQIPGLPINDKRTFEGNTYINHTIRYQNYLISVSRQSEQNYTLEVEEDLL